MECRQVQFSSYDGSLHMHLCARSVCGMQLMIVGCDFVET